MSSDIIAQITELFANWDNLPPALQQSILDGPALLPPVGVDPNFKNPSIGNTSGIILVVICLFFAITATIGRAYSRLVIQKKLYVEDCELLLSRFCLPFLMVIVVSNVLFFATDLAFVGFVRAPWKYP
jgi:hypothetical protein